MGTLQDWGRTWIGGVPPRLCEKAWAWVAPSPQQGGDVRQVLPCHLRWGKANSSSKDALLFLPPEKGGLSEANTTLGGATLEEWGALQTPPKGSQSLKNNKNHHRMPNQANTKHYWILLNPSILDEYIYTGKSLKEKVIIKFHREVSAFLQEMYYFTTHHMHCDSRL